MGNRLNGILERAKVLKLDRLGHKAPTLLLPCSGLQEKILTFLNLSFISCKIRMVSPILYGSIGLKLQRNWG